MWALATSAAALPYPFLDLTFAERLCFFNPSLDKFRLLAMVYRGYHALKFGHRAVIDRCIALEDHDELNILFLTLCHDIWRHL